MKILVAGGSGFLGRALVKACRADGHEVNVLTRHPRDAGDVGWSAAGNDAWISTLDQSDAVVNLAGEGIADQPWTAARKAAIVDSRVTSTLALAQAIRTCARPPRIFISGSAVGFYGTEAEGPVAEDASAGSDFLARVCQSWEQATTAAAGVARIVHLRTGVVLARDGGALPRMALPFRFFVGGRLGSGGQYMSWIHLEDWVGMVQWALGNEDVSEAVNLTAPAPVTNATFTRALATVLHRPAPFPVPAFALRVMLGREMADALLLGGQRVLPAKAQRLGFQFRFATIESALRRIFGN
jgi:uncharacterized protein (TIGR01777 family)